MDIGATLVTDPWSVNIGYPYRVCLLAGAQGDEWPANGQLDDQNLCLFLEIRREISC